MTSRPSSRRRVVGLGAAALAVVALAGCGAGGSTADDGASPAASAPTTDPMLVAGGTADPGSLSDVWCGPSGGSAWEAHGVVTNDGSEEADFRVEVLVAPADATGGTARQVVLAAVPAGDSKAFVADDLRPAVGEDPQCDVSVVRLDPLG